VNVCTCGGPADAFVKVEITPLTDEGEAAMGHGGVGRRASRYVCAECMRKSRAASDAELSELAPKGTSLLSLTEAESARA